MDVTLAGTSLAEGWEVTEQETDGDVDLDIVNAGSSTSIYFEADVDDGELDVDIEIEVGRDFDAVRYDDDDDDDSDATTGVTIPMTPTAPKVPKASARAADPPNSPSSREPARPLAGRALCVSLRAYRASPGALPFKRGPGCAREEDRVVNFASSNLLFLLFLFLHIGSAIVAFGPTFAFPIIGAMGGREPQFANFAMRVNAAISTKLVGPLAIVAGLTGLGLIWTSGRDVLREPWLLLSIVLYVIALLIAVLVTGPASNRLIEATSTPLPPRDPAAGAPGGPPAHIAADLKRIQAAGAALTILTVVILLLMVFKPRF